jgi:hypothetical protein
LVNARSEAKKSSAKLIFFLHGAVNLVFCERELAPSSESKNRFRRTVSKN